jgi:hypothetical protein
VIVRGLKVVTPLDGLDGGKRWRIRFDLRDEPLDGEPLALDVNQDGGVGASQTGQ